jgi:hypothetical protein
MGKPFSDLEKRAFAILAGGGDPAQSNDSDVRNFWIWKLNPTNADHNLPAASERPTGRKLDTIAIEPFAGLPVPGLFANASMSQRTAAAAAAGIKTACGQKTLATGESALWIGRFTPAKVYYRTGAAATSIERTSRITKRTYKSYYEAADEGYSLPFGKVTSTDTIAERQSAIATAIQAAVTDANLISFSPEVFRA